MEGNVVGGASAAGDHVAAEASNAKVKLEEDAGELLPLVDADDIKFSERTISDKLEQDSGKMESKVYCPEAGTTSGRPLMSVMSNGTLQAGNVDWLVESTSPNKKTDHPLLTISPSNASLSRAEANKLDMVDVRKPLSDHSNQELKGQKSYPAIQLNNVIIKGDASGRFQVSKNEKQKGRHSSDSIIGRNQKEVISSPKMAAKVVKNKNVMEESPKFKSGKKRTQEEVSKTSGHVIEYDESLIGARIRVWWPGDRKFYPGVVDSYYATSKRHKVLYFDGDEEKLQLKDEHFEFIKDEEETVSALPIKAAEQLALAEQQPDKGETWQERAVKKAEGRVSALNTLLANLRKELEVAQQRAVEAELKASKSEAKAAEAEKRALEAEAVAEGRAQAAAAAEARERAVAVYKKSPAYGDELAEAYNNGIADALARVTAAFPEVDVGSRRRPCL